jgi:antitoxin ParD1/3/4
MNIHLGEAFTRYIEQQLADGRYANASEVVREALRLKMQHDAEQAAKLAALRKDLQGAIDQLDRGQGIDVTTAQLRKRFKLNAK